MRSSGRILAPLAPLAPSNIFERNVEGLEVEKGVEGTKGSAVALKIANQFSYGNPNYSFKAGGKPPEFYGYEGMGYGGFPEGAEINAGIESSTAALYIVPAGHPTQEVTYAGTKEGGMPHLQEYCEAVPVPQAWRLPSGRLVPIGTDKVIIIWQPSTNRMWEFWRFEGKEGAYTFEFGGYIGEVSKFNGIFTAPEYSEAEGHSIWGASASGLAALGGLITMSDINRVRNGAEDFGHALGVALPVTSAEFIRPATKKQAAISHVPEKNGSEPNPAYISSTEGKDSTSLGPWLRFPPGSTASEHGLTDFMELAVYNTIRKYGVYCRDGGGTCQFYIQSPLALGSIYCADSNPFVGAVEAKGHTKYPYANAVGCAAPTNPSLPSLAKTEGYWTSSFFFKQPWQLLEQLVPRSS